MGKSKLLFKKTRRFTNTALKKAQNLVEMSQINFKISSLKCKVERKCAVIGALVVSKKSGVKKFTPSQCDEKIEKLCKDVEKLRQKIRSARDEADEIQRHMKNCSFCDDCKKSDECDDCDDDFDCDEKISSYCGDCDSHDCSGGSSKIS